MPFLCDNFSTRIRIATTSCLEAWRADTTSAGVEGPGSMAPLKRDRPGGPAQHGSISTERQHVCQSFGLRNQQSSIKSKRL
jgi:hypothetical protein